MDHVDWILLRELQQNGRTSLKRLAELVYLSPPSVASRIERLERGGVITGFSAQVSPATLGYNILAFISLSVEPQQLTEFSLFAERCGNVLECHCVTGPTAMLMKTVFAQTSDLDDFIGKLQRYGHTQTQVVLSSPVPLRGIYQSPASK